MGYNMSIEVLVVNIPKFIWKLLTKGSIALSEERTGRRKADIRLRKKTKNWLTKGNPFRASQLVTLLPTLLVRSRVATLLPLTSLPCFGIRYLRWRLRRKFQVPLSDRQDNCP